MAQGTSQAIGAGTNSLSGIMQNPQIQNVVSTLAQPNGLQPSFGGSPAGTPLSGIGGAGK